jgi:hypothetical protein
MLPLLSRLRSLPESGSACYVAVCSWLVLVLTMTVLNQTGIVQTRSLASSPESVREGKLWLLFSNGVIVQHPVVLSFVSLVLLAVSAMYICGGPATCLSAIAGHVASTLLAYSLYGVVRLSSAHAFVDLGSRPDFGVSAVTAAWLGLVAITAWERRGRTIRGGLAIITSCVAVGLFAWMLRRHVTVIDSDHLFAFAIGASIPFLRRTASSRTNVAAIRRTTD